MIEKNMLGKFIRAKREATGLSQKQFAEQLFVTESAVSKWERGVNYPDITMISDICRVLDVSEKELITASEDTTYRKLKNQSAKYEKMKKITFWIPTAAYLLALFICLICTFAGAMGFPTFMIVFVSLLCAFLFFPSVTNFFTNQKLLIYAGTSALGVALLLVVCGIATRSIIWVPTAISGILLGYVAVFMPIILKKYSVGFISSHKTLICFVSDFVLTAVIVATVRMLTVIDVGKAELIVAYGFVPFLITGFVVSLKMENLIKAGICTAVFSIFVYFINYFMGFVYNYPVDMKVNLIDWSRYTNGNVLLSVLIVGLIASIILGAFGMKKRK